MAIDEKIRNEKMQYNINRDTAKISASKIDNMNILQMKKYYLMIKVK